MPGSTSLSYREHRARSVSVGHVLRCAQQRRIRSHTLLVLEASTLGAHRVHRRMRERHRMKCVSVDRGFGGVVLGACPARLVTPNVVRRRWAILPAMLLILGMSLASQASASVRRAGQILSSRGVMDLPGPTPTGLAELTQKRVCGTLAGPHPKITKPRPKTRLRRMIVCGVC
jgi:hypothetical protein